MGGLGLVHAFVRDKQLILQHATAHANMIAEARRQAVRAIQVRATQHVLRMEARGRAQVASTLHALHNMLLSFTTQHRALILPAALRRRMYGAVVRRNLLHICYPDRNPLSYRKGPAIGLRTAHYRGPAIFPTTPPTQTNTLHL